MSRLSSLNTSGASGGEILAGGLAVVLLAALVFVASLAFAGLILWLAWNLGVVAIVAAAGGAVAKISYLTAVAGAFALWVIRALLFGRG